jgi:protein-S-isoprenylcysteine O-methyltransferase Ste14
MDRIRYALAVLVVATIPPGIVWWYLVHPFVGFWRRLGSRVTLWLVGAAMVAMMIGLGLSRHALVGADLGMHWPLAGSGLVCVGVALRLGIGRKRYLTHRILAGVPELEPREPGELLTEGPYAVIRHPRYVEVLVGVLGYALLANHVGAYGVFLLSIPGLHLVVLLEEKELATRFGAEYQAYRDRVPRWIPRFGTTRRPRR